MNVLEKAIIIIIIIIYNNKSGMKVAKVYLK